jgi:hypothetical protein
MKYMANLSFIGYGNADTAYGGKLLAYSPIDIEGPKWFQDFQNKLLCAIDEKKYFPVYRIGDGELYFLFGPRFFRHKSLAVDVARYIINSFKLSLSGFKNSWGERYSARETRSLRKLLVESTAHISKCGYLAVYFNQNNLRTLFEYNKTLTRDFVRLNIHLSEDNYVPFHFVCNCFMQGAYKDIYRNRKILLVSYFTESDKHTITLCLKKYGVLNVEFYTISANQSLKEKINTCKIIVVPDLILVAAGVGAANIIFQLKCYQCPCIDIGGYMNSFKDSNFKYHANIFGLPV